MGETSNVSELMVDLCSDKGEVIQSAILRFGKLGNQADRDEAFQRLHLLLMDANPWFRLRAVYALQKLGDSRAIQPLIESLGDEDEDVGVEMIEARFEALASFRDSRAVRPLIEQIHRVDFKQAYDMYVFGDDAIGPMIDALKHPRDYTRWQAAYWLGNKRDERAVLPLMEAVGDMVSSVRVREQALYSLGWIGLTHAFPFLMEQQSNPDPRIRSAVANAFGKLNDQKALPILRQMLQDEDRNVRESAAKSIAELQTSGH